MSMYYVLIVVCLCSSLLVIQEKLKQDNLERRLKIETALKERYHNKKLCFVYILVKHRYERSTKETEQLQIVKTELSKIEDLVSADVSLLREKIEEADRNFNKAK